jgi:hypothetical protein
MTHRPRRRLFVLPVVPALALFGACSSSPSGPTGGPVMGALDTHCRDADGGVMATVIGACLPAGTGPQPDGGVVSQYGPTLYNAEGDDDDCKYHVKWTSTAIRQGADVAFTLTLTKLADGTPAMGAGINAEVYLSDTHPAQPPPTASESSGGVYTVSPIKFDAPGDWTVRFHFFEDCDDVPADSPHGHAAFFVRVPSPTK